jgi:hypothetical protein
MFRLPERVFSVDPERARDELAAAWGHLVAAAEHGASQLERASRRRATLARERAAAVRRAARGEMPAARWRWLGVGLAAGAVIGAVGAAVLARRPPGEPAEPGYSALAGVRERASSAVAGAREQASAAAHSAASAARETVGKVRDKVGGDDSPEVGSAAPEPPGRVP